MTVSGRQVTKIQMVLRDLGVTDRAERLRIVSAVIWRDVESTNDLNRDEAHVCIGTLTGIAKYADNPRRALDAIVTQYAAAPVASSPAK